MRICVHLCLCTIGTLCFHFLYELISPYRRIYQHFQVTLQPKSNYLRSLPQVGGSLFQYRNGHAEALRVVRFLLYSFSLFTTKIGDTRCTPYNIEDCSFYEIIRIPHGQTVPGVEHSSTNSNHRLCLNSSQTRRRTTLSRMTSSSRSSLRG